MYTKKTGRKGLTILKKTLNETHINKQPCLLTNYSNYKK